MTVTNERGVTYDCYTIFFTLFIMSCLTKAVDKILRRGGGFFSIKIQVSIHLVLRPKWCKGCQEYFNINLINLRVINHQQNSNINLLCCFSGTNYTFVISICKLFVIKNVALLSFSFTDYQIQNNFCYK